MTCLVFKDSRYIIMKVIGFTPKNTVGYLPDTELQAKYPFIIEDNGSFQICPKKMSAWMKEQIKNGISE